MALYHQQPLCDQHLDLVKSNGVLRFYLQLIQLICKVFLVYLILVLIHVSGIGLRVGLFLLLFVWNYEVKVFRLVDELRGTVQAPLRDVLLELFVLRIFLFVDGIQKLTDCLLKDFELLLFGLSVLLLDHEGLVL